VRDLQARWIGEEAVLAFSLPERNTDGSPARTIRSLEIFRITEKTGTEIRAAFDDLSEESFLGRAKHIYSIPAARFPEYMRGNLFVIRDSPPVEPEADGNFTAYRYAAVFVNEKNQAAGLGRQAIIQSLVVPAVPEGLAAVVTENEIVVTWTPPLENADAARSYRTAYNVYRSEKPDDFPDAPLNSAPIQAKEYRDRNFQFDKNYYYAVRTIAGSDSYSESVLSEILKVEARDIFPPAPPGNFTAIAEDGKVTLFWTPSPSEDVAGYRIFRRNRTEDRSESRCIHEGLIAGISYRDINVASDGEYIYEIHAVDWHGNASEAVASAD
jgi:hypothetical protein